MDLKDARIFVQILIDGENVPRTLNQRVQNNNGTKEEDGKIARSCHNDRERHISWRIKRTITISLPAQHFSVAKPLNAIMNKSGGKIFLR